MNGCGAWWGKRNQNGAQLQAPFALAESKRESIQPVSPAACHVSLACVRPQPDDILAVSTDRGQKNTVEPGARSTVSVTSLLLLWR